MFRILALALALAPAMAPQGVATELIGPSEETVKLDVGKGALLRLDRPARTVFVADPAVADIQVKSARLIYLVAKKPGETSLYAVDENDRVITNRRISVNHNLGRLQRALRQLLPNSLIDVSSVDGSLVLSGAVATAGESEDARRLALRLVDKETDIINKIEVFAPNQVNLRVRVAEVSRDVLKEFGVNWETLARAGDFFFAPLFHRDFLIPDPDIPGARIIQRSRNNDLAFGYQTPNQDINLMIEALEERGLVTILAEPNLTAVSGETASFLAGGEFPILVPEGQDKVIIEFKQFGVSLSFTPTLLGEKRISLMVNPEVSQLSTEGAIEFNGFAIPSLTTRRAKTTVELNSGQSFAIAGLLQNNLTRSINEVPGLADIPILGTLFRSDKFRREESELVIIVTPYIVQPVSNQRLALPTDGLVAPTDVDRILRGRLYRPSLSRRRHGPGGHGAPGLAGQAGFVLN